MADIKKNFVDKNIVYIHGEFDESIIELLPKINDIVIAQKLLKAGKITFSINSNGGYVYILNSLLNIVEQAKKDGTIVETIVEDRAYSCGSQLACSGTIGHRFMSEYAEHLCHYGRGGFCPHTPEQVEREASYLKRNFANIKSRYKKYCEPTAQKGMVTKLFEKMKDDSFFIPAKECIKYGLVDKIL